MPGIQTTTSIHIGTGGGNKFYIFVLDGQPFMPPELANILSMFGPQIGRPP